MNAGVNNTERPKRKQTQHIFFFRFRHKSTLLQCIYSAHNQTTYQDNSMLFSIGCVYVPFRLFWYNSVLYCYTIHCIAFNPSMILWRQDVALFFSFLFISHFLYLSHFSASNKFERCRRHKCLFNVAQHICNTHKKATAKNEWMNEWKLDKNRWIISCKQQHCIWQCAHK